MAALTVDDRLAITQLLATYCRMIDRGQWEELRALFTSDCRLDFGARMGVHEGEGGVRRFTETLRATGLLMRHYTMNVIVTGDGTRARAESHLLAITGPPGSAMLTTGFYEDELVKSDGRWRFRVRRALIDLPA